MSFSSTNIDVIDFLETLGARNLTETGNEAHFSCVFGDHQFGDTKPSAYMNLETTAWLCFSCHRRGNAVSFLAEHQGISPIVAARWLKQAYDPGFKDPQGQFLAEWESYFRQQDREQNELQLLDDDVLDRFASSHGWDYLIGRGYSDETLELFEIGWDTFSQRVTIPIRDEDDRLLGFKARATREDDKPKFLILGDRKKTFYNFKPYHAASVVFNMQRAKHHLADQPCVLSEGELNSIKLWQHGYRNVAGISGSILSDQQALILRRYCGPEGIILFFDSDDAGIRGMSNAAEKLEPYMPVKIVGLHEGDPADMDPDDIDDLIASARSTLEERWVTHE